MYETLIEQYRRFIASLESQDNLLPVLKITLKNTFSSRVWDRLGLELSDYADYVGIDTQSNMMRREFAHAKNILTYHKSKGNILIDSSMFVAVQQVVTKDTYAVTFICKDTDITTEARTIPHVCIRLFEIMAEHNGMCKSDRMFVNMVFPHIRCSNPTMRRRLLNGPEDREDSKKQ